MTSIMPNLHMRLQGFGQKNQKYQLYLTKSQIEKNRSIGMSWSYCHTVISNHSELILRYYMLISMRRMQLCYFIVFQRQMHLKLYCVVFLIGEITLVDIFNKYWELNKVQPILKPRLFQKECMLGCVKDKQLVLSEES